MPNLRTELYLSVGEQDTTRPFVMIDINYSYTPARKGNTGQRGSPEPDWPAEALILGVKVVAKDTSGYILPPWARIALDDQLVAAVLEHEEDQRSVGGPRFREF